MRRGGWRHWTSFCTNGVSPLLGSSAVRRARTIGTGGRRSRRPAPPCPTQWQTVWRCTTGSPTCQPRHEARASGRSQGTGQVQQASRCDGREPDAARMTAAAGRLAGPLVGRFGLRPVRQRCPAALRCLTHSRGASAERGTENGLRHPTLLARAMMRRVASQPVVVAVPASARDHPPPSATPPSSFRRHRHPLRHAEHHCSGSLYAH